MLLLLVLRLCSPFSLMRFGESELQCCTTCAEIADGWIDNIYVPSGE